MNNSVRLQYTDGEKSSRDGRFAERQFSTDDNYVL